MPDADVLALVERIAAAIRGELGAAIDPYPGYCDPDQADPLNRAFRAVVRSLLRTGDELEVDLTATVSQTLFQVATRRLEAEGWNDIQVKMLIEDEPGHPVDWLGFLILADRTQIEPLLDSDPG